jgi:hypothetical protein
MMSLEDWRQRTHDRISASRRASDREDQLGWQVLSDAWVLCAEWRDREILNGIMKPPRTESGS